MAALHTEHRIPFFSYELFDEHPRVTNIVTTRAGGESPRPYDTLNLGLGSGDNPDTVHRNRAVLSEFVGCDVDTLTFGRQVHQVNVVAVGSGDAGKSFSDTDALVTDVPDIPLLVLTADCVSLSFYDPVGHVAGIAHAGWRGTLAGIGARTVEAMSAAFGTRSADLIVGVGPSIGPCCYEVGREVVDEFRSRHSAFTDEILSPSASNKATMMLDLWRANALQLESLGISRERLNVATVCTACNTDRFYSHRAENGKTGRFAGMIMLHSRTRRPY